MSFAQTRHMPPLHSAVGYFSNNLAEKMLNHIGYFTSYLDFTNFIFESLQLQQGASMPFEQIRHMPPHSTYNVVGYFP